MRRWGIVITVFYAAVVIVLLGPGLALLTGRPLSEVSDFYSAWVLWLWVLFLVAGQGLLLFLSVDTSHRRLRPRRHILYSLITGALLFALLSAGLVWSLDAALFGDQAITVSSSDWGIVATWIGLWLAWGWVFWLYLRQRSNALDGVLSWLLKGSVLELLVAVPCHVLVRQRDECSAPALTGFGIVTGVAVMLLSFGPGVLFLYRRRLDGYRRSGPTQR